MRESSNSNGQERFSRNVAFTWGAYLIQVISGFIMPRLISDRLGQETLGIWDFSWSVISYFGLLQLGLGGSVNRYVAAHRAKGDLVALNRSVSTIAFSLQIIGLVVGLVAIIAAVWILPRFGDSLGTGLATCCWVVLILGFKLAIELSLTVYGAVIVGCHRWDIHSSISASTYGISALAMILVVIGGGGLVTLALAISVIYVASELMRRRIAPRVCPGLIVHRKLASWPVFIEQARFSAKNLLPRAADVISAQTMSVLITLFLGPASLAVFLRPRALTLTLRTMAAKFGAILIPTASSLNARKCRSSLQAALRSHPATLSSLTLPILVVLAVFGDGIINVWMGPDYVYPGLMPIFAFCVYPMLVQESIWGILAGMNVHGRVAMAQLFGAIASAAVLGIGLGLFNWSLIGAAICFSFPRFVADGIVTPVLACRRLGVPLTGFYRDVYVKPCLCVSPMGIGLVSARFLGTASLNLAVASATIGSAITLILYGVYLIPAPLRRVLASRCGFAHFGANN